LRIRVHCSDCKSECLVIHEMDAHPYGVDHCPFCGGDVDEDMQEELEEDE